VFTLERELKDHTVLVDLARPERLRREPGVVHRVNVPHRLETEPAVLVVHLAVLPLGVDVWFSQLLMDSSKGGEPRGFRHKL
jgi:hypothetical protein